jgi:hypothetical protein
MQYANTPLAQWLDWLEPFPVSPAITRHQCIRRNLK